MSVKVVLRPVRNEPENAYLAIRSYDGGKSSLNNLGFKIKRKNLKKNKVEVSTAEPDYKEINKKIKQKLSEYRNKGAEKVVEEASEKLYPFIPYFEKVISTTYNEGTRKARLSAKKKFEEFLEEKDITNLTFKKLTPFLMENYKLYLLQNGIKRNSANAYIQTLKLIVNYAKKDDKIKLSKDFDPFHTIDFRRNSVRNKALTKEELKKFADKKWRKDKYNLYKEMFMFQLYGGGLRVSDVLTLRWSNLYVYEGDVVLDYKTYKTNKHMTANLFTNGLHYLNISFNLLFPDFIEKVEKLHKSLENIDKELDKLEMNILLLEEGFDPIEALNKLASGETVDYWEYIDRNRKLEEKRQERASLLQEKNDTKEAILNHYKDHIEEAHTEYGDRFIFPFLWNEEKDESEVNIDTDLINEEDYKKIRNEVSKYDAHLKRLGKLLNIKTSLSTHVSRHTFTQLLMESNVNTHYISIALGHSDIAVTNKYRRTIMNKDALGLSSKLPKL